MMNRLFLSLPLAFLLLLQCTTTSAQPAAAPAPPGPDNITKILEKAGQFTVLLKLLKSTSVGDQINAQLNNSNNGLTFFAPSDNAFASLATGTLNSLSAEQQVELVQFHVVPTFLSMTQFQTVSNPLRTQAGGSGKYEFPLNLATSGNSVNISTGVTNATIGQNVFSDNQLAVYEVDKVLLPMSIFGPQPPAPAPSPFKPKKKPAKAAGPEAASSTVPVNASSRGKLVAHGMMIMIGVSVVGTLFL